MALRRYLDLLRKHPSVIGYWSSQAAAMVAAATLLAVYGYYVMAILALAVAGHAVAFLAAVDRYGRGNLRNVVAVIRDLFTRA